MRTKKDEVAAVKAEQYKDIEVPTTFSIPTVKKVYPYD
jgi:hypothetical protein